MSLTAEEALRRHSEGDRSPEVLAVLNALAFDAFHVPWETQFTQEEKVEDPDSPCAPPEEGWKQDPQFIAPITLARVTHWARNVRKWKFYVKEPDPAVLVRFRYSPARDRAPELHLTVEGRDRNILKFAFRSNTRVAPQDLPRALRLVNWWNQEYRWPKAVVRQDYKYDADDDSIPGEETLLGYEAVKSSELRLEQQLYLPNGIHQGALDAWLMEMAAQSWDFWDIAHRDWGL